MTRKRRFDYLLSSLPGLDFQESAVPIDRADFLSRVRECAGPVASIETIYLADDLLRREAVLAGELPAAETRYIILAPGLEADAGGGDLPPQLQGEADGEGSAGGRVVIDAIWERYFRYAAGVARRAGSRFLRAWVGFEVALRNELVVARAHHLELDPVAYLVAPDLEDGRMDFGGTLAAWSAAADPLAGLEVLDRTRWQWCEAQGRWYSFQADELEAYAVRLTLLDRWARLRREAG